MTTTYGAGLYGAGPYAGGPSPQPSEAPATVGQLGCGTYEAYVVARGGGALVATADWSRLSWSRVLDDTSPGQVFVDAGCVGSLAGTLPWRHELAIFRDEELVWVGPILRPASPLAGDHVAYELDARDVTAWWDHRLIHLDHDYTAGADLATIFQEIAEDAMSVDNSAGLSVTTTPTGIVGNLKLLAVQHLLAGPQLRDLSNTGVDWTTVGRAVLAGGKQIPVPSLGTFLDEHFVRPPQVILDGTNQANTKVVRGAGGGAAGDTIYGFASDAAAALLDGVLESVETVSTIQDNESAQAAAQSSLALTGQAVVSVQDCLLAPSAPVTIDQLVPGASCYLNLVDTNQPVAGRFRLQRVDASAQSSDGNEQVALVFQPIGTT